MNTRDGNIEGFIDHLILGKRENTIKTLDTSVPIEDLVDTITLEDLVDNIITIKAENTIKALNDTISINDMLFDETDDNFLLNFL